MTLTVVLPRRCRGMMPPAVVVACWAIIGMAPRGHAQDPPQAAAADDESSAADDGSGAVVPADRVRERQLDRARRLLASEDWTDASALLDEILADGRDAFVTSSLRGGARRSIRAEAARLVESLPAPGRDAYSLMFRARADRALDDAISRDDAAAIVAVARRWLGTPAGRRAAAIAAQLAAERGDRHAARAWLDRISLATGPAEAWLERATGRGGERRGGWLQPGGDASRNAIAEASRPLLVPRYRVPLTRHPEEARLLESRRRAAAADGLVSGPAATPLAVGDTVVVQTPLGILGIGFETGRRLWLQSGVAPVTDLEASLGRGFDDATGGGLSSDGVHVFAVENPAEAGTGGSDASPGFGPALRPAEGIHAANRLTAYDASDGSVRWRLPASDREPQADGEADGDWFTGAPLVVGDELFALVESKGQLRLDVLDATTGATRWSQPLADLEERQSVTHPDAAARRHAGLTPAAGEGVLVCPLGGGAVVAIDLTTRSLMWAHSYRVAAVRGDIPGGARLRAFTVEVGEPPPLRRGDPWPVIAAGHVVLAPYDSDEVFCLGLRDGRAAWPQPMRGRRQIAGVVDGRVILVGADGVDAVAVDTGRVEWTRQHPPGVRPSGRGLLTPTRLFLPVDAPGVLELAVDDGRLVGRHAVRGGGVPGNLVAFRGEVISRGLDSLDVYHQAGDLEPKIETARLDEARRPWAEYWAGQLELDGGDVARALAGIHAAARSTRVPPHAIADALVFAMQRDRSAAITVWRQWDAADDPLATNVSVLRAVVDGSLRLREDATAWRAIQRLVASRPEPSRGPPITDPLEPGLEVDPDRWVAGRLTELASRAAPSLREEIVTLARRGSSPPPVASEPAVAEPADPTADEWPLGQVAVRRGRRSRSDHTSGATGQMVGLPLAGSVEAVVPGVAVAYDMQHRKLHVLDGFGRRVVEPLPLDPAPSMPWLNQMSPIEPSVVGSTLVVRSSVGVTAFDLSAAAGDTRVLWKTAVRAAPGRGLLTIQGTMGGRVARHGGVPLGRRITELDDAGEPRSVSAPPARATGVLVPQGRSLVLVDPATGRTLWERQGLPRVVEWIADESVACGCTADGRGSPVISMVDGRLMHAVDLPGRRQRLTARGRFVVAVVPVDEGPMATGVRLERIDPLEPHPRPLGEFGGEARATMLPDGRLAVLAADGTFTAIDVDDGRILWATRLPDMPTRFDELHVVVWRDRYLVFAGVAEMAAFDESAAIAPGLGVLATADSTAPLSGAIWAVTRADGRHLWPSPASVRQHCLLVSQPADLPVLVFCRQAAHSSGNVRDLGVLCLDKRTGHAVLDEPRLPVPPSLFVGCEVTGDPLAHSIAIRAAGATAAAVTLGFDGRPLPPQPPYQAEGRLPTSAMLSPTSEPGDERDADR